MHIYFLCCDYYLSDGHFSLCSMAFILYAGAFLTLINGEIWLFTLCIFIRLFISWMVLDYLYICVCVCLYFYC